MLGGGVLHLDPSSYSFFLSFFFFFLFILSSVYFWLTDEVVLDRPLEPHVLLLVFLLPAEVAADGDEEGNEDDERDADREHADHGVPNLGVVPRRRVVEDEARNHMDVTHTHLCAVDRGVSVTVCVWVYVCMYVRMYVCMYVRTYVCMYVRTCMYVCMYARTHAQRLL